MIRMPFGLRSLMTLRISSANLAQVQVSPETTIETAMSLASRLASSYVNINGAGAASAGETDRFGPVLTELMGGCPCPKPTDVCEKIAMITNNATNECRNIAMRRPPSVQLRG